LLNKARRRGWKYELQQESPFCLYSILIACEDQ
jgi:hypothetical protein